MARIPAHAPHMVATLGGLLALPLGLAVLLLPLLATELSRPRDSAWGALVLLLGLVLVTSADRLSGAPMLGVIGTALLLGRLGVEVGQGRWRQLSEEEKRRLGSLERWQTSFRQLGATIGGGAEQLGGLVAGMGERLGRGLGTIGTPGAAKAGARSKGKRWVRPEPEAMPQGAILPGSDSPQEAGGVGTPEPRGDGVSTAMDQAQPAPPAAAEPPAAAAAAAPTVPCAGESEPAAGPPATTGPDGEAAAGRTG